MCLNGSCPQENFCSDTHTSKSTFWEQTTVEKHSLCKEDIYEVKKHCTSAELLIKVLPLERLYLKLVHKMPANETKRHIDSKSSNGSFYCILIASARRNIAFGIHIGVSV